MVDVNRQETAGAPAPGSERRMQPGHDQLEGLAGLRRTKTPWHGVVEPTVRQIRVHHELIAAAGVFEKIADPTDVLDRHRVVLLAPDPEHRRRARTDQFWIGRRAKVTDFVLAWLRSPVEHDHGSDVVTLGAGQDPVAPRSTDADDGDRCAADGGIQVAGVRDCGVEVPQRRGVTDVGETVVLAGEVHVGIEVRRHGDEPGGGELLGQFDRVLHDPVALVADDDDGGGRGHGHRASRGCPARRPIRRRRARAQSVPPAGSGRPAPVDQRLCSGGMPLGSMHIRRRPPFVSGRSRIPPSGGRTHLRSHFGARRSPRHPGRPRRHRPTGRRPSVAAGAPAASGRLPRRPG